MKNSPDVLKLAAGKWPSILMHYGVAERAVSGKHSPCPMCEGKDRFRMIKLDGGARWICNQCGSGDGMDLLMGVGRMSFKQAADWLRPIVSGCDYIPPNRISKEDRRKYMKKNVDIWQEASELSKLTANNTLGQYLATRGLHADEYAGADIRLHANLPYYDNDGKAKGSMPAMLVRIVNREGKLALIHRTYLHKRVDRFEFATKKKMTRPAREWKGGCARLFEVDKHKRMIVAEGVETALSVRAYIYRKHGLLVPCWAGMSANALENMAIPESVKTIMIAADHDESYTGQKVSFTLANRLVVHDKRKVKVIMPQEMNSDFNDELRSIYGDVSDQPESNRAVA